MWECTINDDMQNARWILWNLRGQYPKKVAVSLNRTKTLTIDERSSSSSVFLKGSLRHNMHD